MNNTYIQSCLKQISVNNKAPRMECLGPVKYGVNNSQKRIQKEMHWIENKNSQVGTERGRRNRRAVYAKAMCHVSSQGGQRCVKEAPRGTVLGVGRQHCQKTVSSSQVALKLIFTFSF